MEHWVVREADHGDLFVLIGRRAGLLFQAPALWVDPAAAVAHVWDEWLSLGRPGFGAKLPPVKRITAAGRDWLLARLRGAAA